MTAKSEQTHPLPLSALSAPSAVFLSVFHVLPVAKFSEPFLICALCDICGLTLFQPHKLSHREHCNATGVSQPKNTKSYGTDGSLLCSL